MQIADIQVLLKERISPERYRHSQGVAETAKHLANIYGVNAAKAEICGWLHDIAKDIPKCHLLKLAKQFGIMTTGIEFASPDLLHGPVGAVMAKECYPEIDEDMFFSIYYHTTGRPSMSNLEKIIYIADTIEPNRAYPGVDKLRLLIGTPLDDFTSKVMDGIIKYLIEQGYIIDIKTILARNQFLAKR